MEVKILDLIGTGDEGTTIRKNKEMYVDGNALKSILNISDEEYELSMLNLFRLKCCTGFQSSEQAASIGGIPLRADGGIEKFRVTILGYNLIDNCLR